jgi:hypothetical protein
MALFIEVAFRLVGLDWREYVVCNKGLPCETIVD